MDPQPGCGLAQLPLEVLTRITYFISTNDLANVRLSCRALEQALFSFFSHEFFRKKQFMVSTFSLQALIDIANHPTLSLCLRHVIVCCDRPSSRKWVSDRNDAARARLEVADADHMHLLAAGGLRDMLGEAFARLPNLETVDIRDFNAPSRTRDGLDAQWRSYGAGTLGQLTATPPFLGPRGDQDPYPSQVFAATTAALAAANARPRSLEVLLRSGGPLPFGLHDTAFYIPPRMEVAMSALLAGLKSLHLTFSLSCSLRMRPFMFQKFLSMASNITWLRLNFNRTQEPDYRDVLTWLALRDNQSPQATFDLPPIQLPYLEQLDLGTVDTDAKIILNLVSKFARTLTSVSLRRVSLHEHDCHLKDPRVSPWVGCLSKMARLPGLNLRVLSLSSISHSGNGWKRHVSFKTTSQPQRVLQDWTCSATLVTMDKAIAQAIAAMAPMWPVLDPTPMDEDDSDEEEEEEEDEDDEDEGEGSGDEE